MQVIAHEGIVRLASFLGVLAVVATAEIARPRRPLTQSKARRWFANLSLVLLNTAVIRLLAPILPVGLAVLLHGRGWGVMNLLALPGWLEIVLALLLLDLIIYLQHLSFHQIPLFWRLHRMHHTDLDIDVTTGNRFHPLEIIVSSGIKSAAVFLLGPPAMAVVLFELVLNATSQFNHGNIALPETADRLLRLVVVTPDMHRVHHSVIPRETNSNFGFNFPWWDRLFGTYRPQPQLGHREMTIGLREFRDPGKLTLGRLLLQPFIRR